MQQPRQLYGLGSFVKSVGKAVKGVGKAVKNVAKSDLGKAALTAAALYYGGGGNLFGLQRQGMTGFRFANLPGAGFFTGGAKASSPSLMSIGDRQVFNAARTAAGLGQTGLSTGAKVGLGITGASILGGLSTAAQQDVAQLRESGDKGLLRGYLKRYYENLNPQGEEESDEAYDAKVSEFVRTNMARGGDTAEENAMQASGIMNLPLNQNPAGVTELDLRETGGFIPPVGVKEKADDIPAMLSNNEFVFTADAVRGMGDGDVNRGAQRMYDMMKKLENGGRV
jgi:hypothetical protein